MLTLKHCRKIDPTLNDLTDEELGHILECLYGVGELALESWLKNRGSKIPFGLLPNKSFNDRIKV